MYYHYCWWDLSYVQHDSVNTSHRSSVWLSAFIITLSFLQKSCFYIHRNGSWNAEEAEAGWWGGDLRGFPQTLVQLIPLLVICHQPEQMQRQGDRGRVPIQVKLFTRSSFQEQHPFSLRRLLSSHLTIPSCHLLHHRHMHTPSPSHSFVPSHLGLPSVTLSLSLV